MKRFFCSEDSSWKPAKWLSAVLAASAPALSLAGAQDRPNIIFILADDQGPDSISCYGGQTYAGCTPRIDALAANGLRFNHCYAQPICSPSRAQYLSGQYPFRNGVICNDGCNVRFELNKPCLTKVLHDAGYTTGGSGKSVADDFYSYFDPETGTSSLRDFMDEYLSAGSGDYVDVKKYKFKGPSTIKPDKYPYFPDAMQAFALDFVRRNRPSSENGNKPFYLYYSLIHPHAPLLPTPDAVPGVKMTNQEMYRDYVKYIDKLVGELVDELKNLGLLDNTMIVYSGDNGCWGWGLQGDLHDPKTGKYRPISGGKSDEWELREGTALVPLIIHWPAAIKKSAIRDDLIDFTDMLPTFAEVAGVRTPENWKLDGRSFAPLLRGDSGWKPREWSYVQLQYNWCVRGPQYRLNRDGRLFDMSDAPFGMTEILLGNDTPESAAARASLQTALNRLDPENGSTYESTQDYYYYNSEKTSYYMGGSDSYLVKKQQKVNNKNPAAKIWDWKVKYFDWAKRWEYQFSGDNADPDHDGVPNIFERAFGWDPTNGTDKMPEPEFKSGTREIIYPPVSTNSGVILTAVNENGAAPDETTDIKNIRFNAARTVQWPTPPALDPERPAIVR